ncbi:MAG: PAS domain S-box protein, partial [Anaerolineales bacterium]|nr:PAS domain S-box protein [Anaerolineales bacterium]
KDASSRYIQVNLAMERLLGLPRSAILGKSDVELFGEEAAKPLIEADQRVLQGEHFSGEDDFEINGQQYTFSVVKTPLRNSNGTIIGICGIARDITAQKRAESALRESEAHFRELFENASDLIQSVDPEGRFLYVNRAWREAMGYTEQEILQLNLIDVLAPECRSHCLELFNRILHGERVEFVTATFVTKDKRRIEVEGSVSNRWAGGKVVATVGIYRDLSKRAEIERALRESEARYRNIFETAAVSIWEEDFSAVKAAIEELRRQGVSDFERYLEEHPQFLQLAAQNIRVRDVNPMTLQMFGAKTKAELLDNLSKIIPADSLSILKEEILAIAAGKTYFSSETVNLTLQGKRIDVLLSITFPPPENREAFQSVLVTLMDITDRKQVEREVEKQRILFQQLFENTPVAIAMLDTQDRFVRVNRAFETLFGYKDSEVVGNYINELIIPPGLTEEASGLSMALFSGSTVEKETVRMRKDKTMVPVQVYAAPVQVGAEVVGGYAMYLDLSDRKQKEQKLEYLSSHDTLTDLYNRAYFEIALSRMESENILPISILVADVDGLKRVNDEQGHRAGDKLLRSAAEILRACFRSEDVVARIGGDEFAVLLPHADDRVAEQLVHRIASNLRRYNLCHPQSPVHLSYGIATASQPMPLAQLFNQADRKMYEHKARKRSRKKSPKASNGL